MKIVRSHLLILSLIIFCVFTTATGQTSIGLKGGLNLADIESGESSGPLNNLTARPLFHAGLQGRLVLDKRASFQAELLYNQKGAESRVLIFQGPDVRVTHRLDYISLPVLFQLHFGRFFLEAGPEASYLLASRVKIKEAQTDPAFLEAIFEDNQLDFGFNFGAGYRLGEHLSLNLRYGLGLSNISDIEFVDGSGNPLNTRVTYANRVLQASVGVWF